MKNVQTKYCSHRGENGGVAVLQQQSQTKTKEQDKQGKYCNKHNKVKAENRA